MYWWYNVFTITWHSSSWISKLIGQMIVNLLDLWTIFIPGLPYRFLTFLNFWVSSYFFDWVPFFFPFPWGFETRGFNWDWEFFTFSFIQAVDFPGFFSSSCQGGDWRRNFSPGEKFSEKLVGRLQSLEKRYLKRGVIGGYIR